jgi:catechol 2,3-dioxygenase
MTTPSQSQTNLLRPAHALQFSHMGLYVQNLPRMAAFYKDVLCFTETDKGNLGPVDLVFLSRDPREHHQLVLASGRPVEATFSVVNQISLRVPDLPTLKFVHQRVLKEPDVSKLVSTTHGNAVSIYFRDPEGNRLEIFMDTPWYCEQPLSEPISLEEPDEVILQKALAMAQGRPKFMPRAQWQAELEAKMLNQAF